MRSVLVVLILIVVGECRAQIPGAPTEAEVRAQHEAAIAKLPSFGRDRLEHLVSILEQTKYPIPFTRLEDLFGGHASLVWLSSAGHTIGEFHTGTDTFALTRPSRDRGTYVLVVDYAHAPVDTALSSVIRARVAFDSPFEWRFFAASTKPLVEIGQQSANQPPQRNAGSRPSSGDSPASETPSSLGPRG